MPLIIIEWKVSFRLIENNIMNLTRAIKLPSLFSSKSSTPAGACLLRLVIENFLEMMANSFSWCANSSSSEIGSSLKVCCDSIPTYQQLSAALPLFYLSGTFRSFLIKKNRPRPRSQHIRSLGQPRTRERLFLTQETPVPIEIWRFSVSNIWAQYRHKIDAPASFLVFFVCQSVWSWVQSGCTVLAKMWML